MPSTEFGVLLKRLRKEKGETQESLALKSGVTYVALGNWERGIRNPERKNVVAVAEALGVRPDELLFAAGFTSPRPDDEAKMAPVSPMAAYEIVKVVQDGKEYTRYQYPGIEIDGDIINPLTSKPRTEAEVEKMRLALRIALMREE